MQILTEDHPRLRGEYVILTGIDAAISGSPPLARGVPCAVTLASASAGITPACAGSTASKTYKRVPLEDHPRLRGEYSDSTLLHQCS